MAKTKRAPQHAFKLNLPSQVAGATILVRFKERKGGRLIQCEIFGPLTPPPGGGGAPSRRPLWYKGEAHCHAVDQPNQAKGRRLALFRALNQPPTIWTSEERGAFFSALDLSERPILHREHNYYTGTPRALLLAIEKLMRRGVPCTLTVPRSVEVWTEAGHAILDENFNIKTLLQATTAPVEE